MRVRLATTALGITALLLTLPACSTTAPGPSPGQPGGTADKSVISSSAALEPRLLDEGDLGSRYLRKPEQDGQHADATVIGCPALSKLGGDAATGGTLSFPHKATTAFVSGDNSSEVSEELYNDSADKPSDGIAHLRRHDRVPHLPGHREKHSHGRLIAEAARAQRVRGRAVEPTLTFSARWAEHDGEADRGSRRQHSAGPGRLARPRRPESRQGSRPGNGGQLT